MAARRGRAAGARLPGGVEGRGVLLYAVPQRQLAGGDFDLADDLLQAAIDDEGVGRPLFGIFLQQIADNVVEPVGNVGNDRSRPVELAVLVLVNDVERRFAGEGRPPGEHHVHHRAERVEIAPPGDPPPLPLLGRHVLGRADDAAGDRQLRAGKDLRDAEVGELDVAVGRQQQVRRLEIAVDDPRIMRAFEGQAESGSTDRSLPATESASRVAAGR